MKPYTLSRKHNTIILKLASNGVEIPLITSANYAKIKEDIHRNSAFWSESSVFSLASEIRNLFYKEILEVEEEED